VAARGQALAPFCDRADGSAFRACRPVDELTVQCVRLQVCWTSFSDTGVSRFVALPPARVY
jgi:hypothetical protein